MSSRRLGAAVTCSPDSSPNDDTYPVAFFESSGHELVSLSRAIDRVIAKPKGAPLAGLNRNCEKGMRNSAFQPSRSRLTVTSHTASQLSSVLVSLNQYLSCLTPAGLTANSYAVRRS